MIGETYEQQDITITGPIRPTGMGHALVDDRTSAAAGRPPLLGTPPSPAAPKDGSGEPLVPRPLTHLLELS